MAAVYGVVYIFCLRYCLSFQYVLLLGQSSVSTVFQENSVSRIACLCDLVGWSAVRNSTTTKIKTVLLRYTLIILVAEAELLLLWLLLLLLVAVVVVVTARVTVIGYGIRANTIIHEPAQDIIIRRQMFHPWASCTEILKWTYYLTY